MMSNNPNLQDVTTAIPNIGTDRARVIDFRKFKAFDVNGAELCTFHRADSDHWSIAGRDGRFTPLPVETAIALENLYISWLARQIVE